VTDPIHVFTRADACGAADVWAKFLGDMKQEDLLGIAVQADPGLLEAVVKDPLAIGYNNLNYAYDAEQARWWPGRRWSRSTRTATARWTRMSCTPQSRLRLMRWATARTRRPRPVTEPGHQWQAQRLGAGVHGVGADRRQQLVPQAGYIQLPAEQLDGELAKLSDERGVERGAIDVAPLLESLVTLVGDLTRPYAELLFVYR